MTIKRIGGSIVNNHVSVGAIAIGEDVNHLYGNSSTLISKPDDCSLIVFEAESGNFRFKSGDHTANGTGDLTSYSDPSETINDGTGAFKLSEGKSYTLQAVKDMTFIGDSADAVLTYYFV